MAYVVNKPRPVDVWLHPFRSSIDNKLEVHVVNARILDLPIDEFMDVLSTDDCIAFESGLLTEPKPFRHAASALHGA